MPLLLADLALQRGVAFEVLVSDGHSTDGTRERVVETFGARRLVGRVISGPAGRGRQLNRGAVQARGAWLLFLHADSRLPAPDALASALACLRSDVRPHLAGRFSLRFDPAESGGDFGCYLCEVKARSGRSGTIHGDQGFLLPAAFFNELGRFREDLPVLEDTLLAEAIRANGAWRLLPATIVTSPRRFLTEGYRERQTLNALLVNFVMIGWDEPLHLIPDLYRSHDRTSRLDLVPYFRRLDDLLCAKSWRERWRIWFLTGAFVQANAWQLVLKRTARQAFAAGVPAADVSLRPVERFQRWFEPLTGNAIGAFAAALLTWLWFRSRARHPRPGE